MFCRKCGNQISDDSDFCSKCGAKVKSEPEPQNSELWMYNNALNRMNTAKSVSEFETVENIFESLGEYKDSVELLKKCREEKIPLIYDYAVDLMNSAQSYEGFKSAAENFKAVGNYKDSEEFLKKCEYNQKLWVYNDGYKKFNAAESLDEFKAAEELFASIPGFEDSDELGKKCRDNINEIIYNEALAEMDDAQTDEDFTEAAEMFKSITGYKDADNLAEKCEFNKKALVYNDALEKVRFAQEDFELTWFRDLFLSLGDFKDAPFMVRWCEKLLDGDSNSDRVSNDSIDDQNGHSNAPKAITSFPEKAVLYNSRASTDKDDQAVVQEESAKKLKSFNCPDCGAEIISPEIGFCPYCFVDFKYTPILVTEKSEVSPIKNSQASEEEIEKIEVNIDKNTSRRPDPGISTEIENKNKNIKCTRCGQTLYPWHSRCPNCGTPKPGAYWTNAASSPTSQQNSFEEDYQSIKTFTLISIYVIMTVVVIVVFGSGNAACTGVDEVSYTPSALYAIVGGGIGLNVLRGIILLVYKATHKSK